jgi:carbamoyltransferase
MTFPHSLGLLYATITAYLGFEVNEGEYKVMGLAGFGKPNYVKQLKKLFSLFPDGSIQLNLKYFAYPYDTEKMFTNNLVKLLGKPRKPGLLFFTAKTAYPSYYEKKPADFKKQSLENQRYADIAASLQLLTEEIILAQVRHVHQTTGLTKLCMAGGVALNGVANGRIVKETPIKELFIQPAAGDSGGAMGAALYASHYFLKEKRNYRMQNAYLGPEFSEEEAVFALKKQNLGYKKLQDTKLTEKIVNDLKLGKVVGWFQGRLEWGPRALGNRSILADPRRKDMKDIINIKIKFREPFRPFAPVVISQKASLYFDLPDIQNSQPAKFMTIVCNVKNDKKREIPAIVHVDGTGRLQTIDRNINKKYFDVVKKFGDETGVYVLLNTSFNLKGEAIVCTPEDAVSTFLRSGIDVLVLGNLVTEK